MLVSTVLQSESVIHIHVSPFFNFLPTKVTTEFPELYISVFVNSVLLLTLEHIHQIIEIHPNHQLSSVAQSCLTLCDPMDCSMPGIPIHHQLPGFTQTHVYQVSDAIQPSHPLLSPSPPTFNLSQH